MSRNTSMPEPNATRSKVFWTEAEKKKVVQRAREIQANHPDLAGLPLLRAAITALPPARRRKLIAVSQAAWFEDGLKAEVRMAELEVKMRDPHLILDQARNKMIEDHYEMYAKLLKDILEELRTLNRKLGNPVPTISQSRGSRGSGA